MAAKKPARKSLRTHIINASPARIRQGLKALEQLEKLGGLERVRKSMKLLVVLERFVKTNGRFKRKYKRKTATNAPTKKK